MLSEEQVKQTLENILHGLRGSQDDDLLEFAFEQCVEEAKGIYGDKFVEPYLERYNNIVTKFTGGLKKNGRTS